MSDVIKKESKRYKSVKEVFEMSGCLNISVVYIITRAEDMGRRPRTTYLTCDLCGHEN